MIRPFVAHISTILGDSDEMNKQKRERIATQRLLNLFYPDTILEHTPEGKPYLSGQSSNVSISHSGDYLALLIASPYWHVGVDLESNLHQPKRLVHRFLSEEELDFLGTLPKEDQDEFALMAWCSREAVFKALPNASPDFRRHYALKGFPLQPLIQYKTDHQETLAIPIQNYRHEEYLLVHCTIRSKAIVPY
ncbi:MAG: 4'-phosphopantetheinyl transferase superfamily protein [Bacteroidales bacterium]|nr:4'-phosphopantetheinyl transferase superfamily protein [Porphyromonas sp.]MDD6935169.1 4'-phosphopantetheinyl transferase superfamily protein [Bacteroidales bacterium]MDY3102398.1 4'-phosphopantetheinyl transferase superfamily protein [Porphyromonas sp.]